MAIELMYAGCQVAKTAAQSEISSFFEFPEYRIAVKRELGISNDVEAAIAWATKRAEQWQPFDRGATPGGNIGPLNSALGLLK